ncbi:hypothetical protein CSKR_103780 [Clonorchis sinensis]|uniref:Uncharacterized protein n=1 Tax=Clonorchis sinensis TaxID=79923 RepID=A0A3R7JRU0_CLOSI|nr:hypothetical protein CSKR_103780 [Clonorchis sinensis]
MRKFTARFLYSLPRGGLLCYLAAPQEASQIEKLNVLFVDLFAELGSWIANVSSPIEVTSSLNPALMMSPRLVMKRLQSNCQARRTDQRTKHLISQFGMLRTAICLLMFCAE